MNRTAKKKVLFVSDIHAPYQDDNAIDALVSFSKWFKPDDIIFLGDVIDFYSLSVYNKDPIRATQLNLEIDTAIEVIDKILSSCSSKSKKYFVAGNHSERLQKYLWSKSPELSYLNALTVKSLLKLDEKGIKYFPSGRMKYNGIIVKHGDIVRRYSSYTAKAESDSEGMSGISGHTHRIGTYNHTNTSGKKYWVEAGCLCRLDQEYLRGKTANWQQGFAVGYIDGKELKIEPVYINNGKILYSGKKFD